MFRRRGAPSFVAHAQTDFVPQRFVLNNISTHVCAFHAVTSLQCHANYATKSGACYFASLFLPTHFEKAAGGCRCIRWAVMAHQKAGTLLSSSCGSSLKCTLDSNATILLQRPEQKMPRMGYMLPTMAESLFEHSAIHRVSGRHPGRGKRESGKCAVVSDVDEN